MISTLRHSVSLAKIPVAVLVLSAFLLGQFVEVWHYHAPRNQQRGVAVGESAAQDTAVGHDSCSICSSTQFLKDACIKPVTTVFSWGVKTTKTFLKHTLYQFLSSILRPGRAPPAL
ncbi:MAG: hypothetical protein U0264_13020 [Candidatus Kapaibacterium sp.]